MFSIEINRNNKRKIIVFLKIPNKYIFSLYFLFVKIDKYRTKITKITVINKDRKTPVNDGNSNNENNYYRLVHY